MVDAAQLVPGDIILLAIGNVVPADCKLLGSSEDEPLQVSLQVPCDCELSSAELHTCCCKQAAACLAAASGCGAALRLLIAGVHSL